MTRNVSLVLTSTILLAMSLLCYAQQNELVQENFQTKENNSICGFDRNCVQLHRCTDQEYVDRKLCGFKMICCKNTNQTNTEIVPDIRPNQHYAACGYRNSDNSLTNMSSQSPWLAVVMQYEDENLGSQFGGSIIAPTVILTSAHKVKNLAANVLVVHAGNLSSKADTQEELRVGFQEQRVREIIMHEHFHEGKLHNDIALLIVAASFVWDAHVRPICLPPQDANFDNVRCFATGWGMAEFELFDSSSNQNNLNEFQVPVVPSHKCQTQLRTTFLGIDFQLHNSFICAGGEEDKDTCKGDGGSPLVCPVLGHTNRFYQAGIVSWGMGCGRANVPGVYVNVARFRQWINVQLSNKDIEYRGIIINNEDIK